MRQGQKQERSMLLEIEEQNYLLSFDDARRNGHKKGKDTVIVAHLMEMVSEEVIEVRSRS